MTSSIDDTTTLDSTDSSESDDTFSDQAHLRASFAFLPPHEHTAQKEEQDALHDAAATIQKVTDSIITGRDERQAAKETGGTTKPATRRRSSLLKASMIQTFSAQEEGTVLKVLKEISKVETKHRKEGFKEVNFTAGVMNCFLVAYLFGAYPQHFWLLYLVESLYHIPSKYLNMIRARPLNQALYYFDFCWMMNFNAIFALLLLVAPLPLSASMRRFLYQAGFGICCGPLLGACAILPFVGFVFHDLNTMANVVIHSMPCMMFYTIRWHAEEIREAWPNVFSFQEIQDPNFFPKGIVFLPGQGLGSIAGNVVLIYMLWWIPYVSWMLLMGMDLPRKNMPNGKPPVYDTVFHSFWRVGACQSFGTMLWKRPIELSQTQMETDDYEKRDFMFYIGAHAIAALASIPTLAFCCNYSKQLHGFLLFVVLLICVHRGAQRYTYYSTKMYSRLIQKEFLPSKK